MWQWIHISEIITIFTQKDGWVRVLRPFNSISVTLRRWMDEHERLCAMKRRLGSGRISPPAGFEPATPWTEIGSANRSATRTLLYAKSGHGYLKYGVFVTTSFDAVRICIQHCECSWLENLHFDPFLFGGRVSKRRSMCAWIIISMVAYVFWIHQSFIKATTLLILT